MSKSAEAVMKGPEFRVRELFRPGKSFFMRVKGGQDALLLQLREAAAVPLERLARSLGIQPMQTINSESHVDSKDINERTMLMRAAANGDAARVLDLLDAGADTALTDKDGKTALVWAEERGHREVVAILTNRLDEALFIIAKEGDAQTAEKLIDKGADPNAEDSAGRLVLAWAALMDRPETVDRLIARGAKPNLSLMYISSYGLNKATEMLIDRGADVNARDELRWTPLMRAARNGHTKTAEMLIAKGAKVNARNNVDWTALIIASHAGHTETAEMLIGKGADVNARDREGRTALWWTGNHPDTAAMLRKHGTVI